MKCLPHKMAHGIYKCFVCLHRQQGKFSRECPGAPKPQPLANIPEGGCCGGGRVGKITDAGRIKMPK